MILKLLMLPTGIRNADGKAGFRVKVVGRRVVFD